jgi:hypothetical protein
MKKAARLAALAGVLASVCWFSVQEAQGGPKPPCSPNMPCVTDWDCVTNGIRGLCSFGACICP